MHLSRFFDILSIYHKFIIFDILCIYQDFLYTFWCYIYSLFFSISHNRIISHLATRFRSYIWGECCHILNRFNGNQINTYRYERHPIKMHSKFIMWGKSMGLWYNIHSSLYQERGKGKMLPWIIQIRLSVSLIVLRLHYSVFLLNNRLSA